LLDFILSLWRDFSPMKLKAQNNNEW
jgi:hypothetical protein